MPAIGLWYPFATPRQGHLMLCQRLLNYVCVGGHFVGEMAKSTTGASVVQAAIFKSGF